MRISVVVTPKADRDEIVGWKTDADGRVELAVRVRVAPEGGKATKRACELIAERLSLGKTAVVCVRGQSSRHKQMEISGIDEDEVNRRLV